MKRFLSLAVLAAALAGCGATMDLPDGFVQAHKRGRSGYRIRGVSADGVVAGVREGYRNPANGTLDFWATAIRNELVRSRGYVPVSDQPVKSDTGRCGRLMTFQSRRSGAAFTYMVAVYVTDRQVRIAEAGGRTEAVQPKMVALKSSLLSVR